MDLLDRYLAAIRNNLPAARADDIIAELRDALLDRVEAREAAADHGLDKREIGALLKDFGHPLVIAARYRQHQYLIGPESFPFYLYGLRVVLVIALVVLVFAGFVPLLMGGGHAVDAFLAGLGHAYQAFILGFGWLTIVFAIGERIGSQGARLAVWKPESLPPVIDQKRRGKWRSPIEIGIGLMFMLWWAVGLPLPLVGLSGTMYIAGGPLWTQLYWPVIALGLALLVTHILDWQRPDRVTLRHWLALATTVGALALLGYMRGNGPLLIVRAADMQAAARIENGLDAAVHIVLMIALFAWGIRAVMLIYQLGLRRFMLGR